VVTAHIVVGRRGLTSCYVFFASSVRRSGLAVAGYFAEYRLTPGAERAGERLLPPFVES